MAKRVLEIGEVGRAKIKRQLTNSQKPGVTIASFRKEHQLSSVMTVVNPSPAFALLDQMGLRAADINKSVVEHLMGALVDRIRSADRAALHELLRAVQRSMSSGEVPGSVAELRPVTAEVIGRFQALKMRVPLDFLQQLTPELRAELPLHAKRQLWEEKPESLAVELTPLVHGYVRDGRRRAALREPGHGLAGGSADADRRRRRESRPLQQILQMVGGSAKLYRAACRQIRDLFLRKPASVRGAGRDQRDEFVALCPRDPLLCSLRLDLCMALHEHADAAVRAALAPVEPLLKLARQLDAALRGGGVGVLRARVVEVARQLALLLGQEQSLDAGTEAGDGDDGGGVDALPDGAAGAASAFSASSASAAAPVTGKALVRSLTGLLGKLANLDKDDVFGKPVIEANPQIEAAYLAAIAPNQPMDLSTMILHARSGKYGSFAALRVHFELMVENCLKFNPEPDNFFHKAGRRFRKEGRKRIDAWETKAKSGGARGGGGDNEDGEGGGGAKAEGKAAGRGRGKGRGKGAAEPALPKYEHPADAVMLVAEPRVALMVVRQCLELIAEATHRRALPKQDSALRACLRVLWVGLWCSSLREIAPTPLAEPWEAESLGGHFLDVVMLSVLCPLLAAAHAHRELPAQAEKPADKAWGMLTQHPLALQLVLAFVVGAVERVDESAVRQLLPLLRAGRRPEAAGASAGGGGDGGGGAGPTRPLLLPSPRARFTAMAGVFYRGLCEALAAAGRRAAAAGGEKLAAFLRMRRAVVDDLFGADFGAGPQANQLFFRWFGLLLKEWQQAGAAKCGVSAEEVAAYGRALRESAFAGEHTSLRQAAKASAKAAWQAWRAVHACGRSVDEMDELIAVYRRGYRTPWSVPQWRDGVRYSERDYLQDTTDGLNAEAGVYERGIAERQHGLEKAREACERKLMAAAKSEKVTVRAARERQARRELELSETELQAQIDAFQVALAPVAAQRAGGAHCGDNAVADAARVGRVPQLRRLLRERASRGGGLPTRAEAEIGVRGGCPLALDVLLAHGARADEADRHGSTLLHCACHRGQAEMAALLLEHGASVRARNALGRTPLHLACASFAHYRAGKLAAARLLLEAGADIDARDVREVMA
eukprot:g4475.t1